MLRYELPLSAALGMVSVSEGFCFCEMPECMCVCLLPISLHILLIDLQEFFMHSFLNFFIEV